VKVLHRALERRNLARRVRGEIQDVAADIRQRPAAVLLAHPPEEAGRFLPRAPAGVGHPALQVARFDMLDAAQVPLRHELPRALDRGEAPIREVDHVNFPGLAGGLKHAPRFGRRGRQRLFAEDVQPLRERRDGNLAVRGVARDHRDRVERFPLEQLAVVRIHGRDRVLRRKVFRPLPDHVAAGGDLHVLFLLIIRGVAVCHPAGADDRHADRGHVRSFQ